MLPSAQDEKQHRLAAALRAKPRVPSKHETVWPPSGLSTPALMRIRTLLPDLGSWEELLPVPK